MQKHTETSADNSIRLEPTPAFVLGNGPSLKDVDLHQLSPYATLGMNAAYRHWDRINWRPTHYACLDVVVGISHLDGIRRLIREGRGSEGDLPAGIRPIGQFALRQNVIDALGPDGDDPRVVNFDALRAQTALLKAGSITTGSHALLWLAHLGFDPIFLLGIDGNYKEIVSGARRKAGIVLEIVEQQDNPNYFFADYQQPGDRYHVPNPRPGLHAGAWVDAARELASRVNVANGNPASSVRVFPFVDLPTLLAKGEAPTIPGEPIQPRPGFLRSMLSQDFKPLAKAGLLALLGGAVAGLLAAFDLTVLLAFFFAALITTVVLGLLLIVRGLRALRTETANLQIQMKEVARQSRIGSGRHQSED